MNPLTSLSTTMTMCRQCAARAEQALRSTQRQRADAKARRMARGPTNCLTYGWRKGRAEELTTLCRLCSVAPLLVIPRSTLQRGTKTVRRQVEDIKGEIVKSKFVAEVAGDVRSDVRATTPAVKALWMIPSPAATRGGRCTQGNVALCDIVAAFVFVHLVEGTPRRSKGVEAVAAALHESVQHNSDGARAP